MSFLILAVVGYGVIALLIVRPLAGHFAWHFFASAKVEYKYAFADFHEPKGDQWFGALVLALVIAALWPFVGAWILVGHCGPSIGAERRAQLRAREERIREAERELGIIS